MKSWHSIMDINIKNPIIPIPTTEKSAVPTDFEKPNSCTVIIAESSINTK